MLQRCIVGLIDLFQDDHELGTIPKHEALGLVLWVLVLVYLESRRRATRARARAKDGQAD
ncbi:MAG: hypothetical protein P1V81_05550 [Planctomycetota bacterium]|nr:hypothetical protein [Planctomycetota bacterium]